MQISSRKFHKTDSVSLFRRFETTALRAVLSGLTLGKRMCGTRLLHQGDGAQGRGAMNQADGTDVGGK